MLALQVSFGGVYDRMCSCTAVHNATVGPTFFDEWGAHACSASGPWQNECVWWCDIVCMMMWH